MPIETKCSSCGKVLRVGDEHAGKQARCPVCNTVFQVPAETAPAVGSAPNATDRWSMKTPEGQVYGPVPKADLDRWLAEGRIASDCQLRSAEDAPWRPADEYYPALRPLPRNPFADAPGIGQSSYAPSPAGGVYPGPPTGQATFLLPHRGGLILALGILGWFSCPIFSVLAWAFGTSDLREMRAGRMDPSGMGLTQAGQILGVINSVLWLVGLVLGIFIFVLAAAGAAM